MATMSRTDSLGGAPDTPTMSSKGLNGSLTNGFKYKAGPPRIDMEPIYQQLQAAIGDKMPLYRDSIGAYMLGRLNQEELSLRIDPFIHNSAQTTHLHNQFIAGIYTNSYRDPPETDIAPFVSSHDKPTTTASGKPVSGDAMEQQLKAEVMGLPARERHRLKQLAEQGKLGDMSDDFLRIMRSIRERDVIKPPDVVPTSAGGFNKTNWELEIGKRFELPLFSESNEFPDTDMIQKRMTPLCYQEGLAGGAGQNAAELVNVAAEMFVKQMLTDGLRRVRSNGVKYIQTAKFRRRLAREESQLARGSIKRDGFGLLPVEHEVERQRAPFGMEDLRFSLMLGGSYMNQDKLLTAKIMDRTLDREEVKQAAGRGKMKMVNGSGSSGGGGNAGTGALTNGHMNGGAPVERTALDDTLDDILDFGS